MTYMPGTKYTAISEEKHKLYAGIVAGFNEDSCKKALTVKDVQSCSVGKKNKVWRNQGLVDQRTKDIRGRLSRKLAIRENVANLVKLMDKVDRTDPDQERIYDMYATRKAGLEQMLAKA